jgi:large subunit ribosomal protein L2
MALVKVKPTSPGRRGVVKVVNPNLHKGRPHDKLVESKSRTAGRNAHGHITTRHMGGGHKKLYRVIDFRRDKDGIPGKVENIQYDPNRSANIALVLYADGERRYMIAIKGMVVGQEVLSGSEAPIKPGNALADSQHSRRYDNPLRRNDAGEGRSNCSFCRNLGAASGA